MNYEQAFIDMAEKLTSKLNAEMLAYDLICRKSGSASYGAAKALGVMRSTQDAIDIMTASVCMTK